MSTTTLSAIHDIENFYGCYLLVSKNERCKGHTYIGFTVDPNRRIKQHNAGKKAGGAWRTSGRGPWDMVLIIHGFPNEISALRFEWAWQHPEKSRRLKHIPSRQKKEHGYKYRFRIAAEMLRVGPWNRLPLTIRWLNQDYCLDFPAHLAPPTHMPVVYGPLKTKKVKPNPSTSESAQCSDEDADFAPLVMSGRCPGCGKHMEKDDNVLKCVHPKCHMQSHTTCLAKLFLGEYQDEVIPVEGKCPKCHQNLLWGDLIRFKRGCYQYMQEGDSTENPDSSDQDHWANVLTQT